MRKTDAELTALYYRNEPCDCCYCRSLSKEGGADESSDTLAGATTDNHNGQNPALVGKTKVRGDASQVRVDEPIVRPTGRA